MCYRFITFTGNPKWDEIQQMLKNGETVGNRPDIVCRIFIAKAKELIYDLTERQVMGKLSAWCYSMKHQKRGMPHLHILLILSSQYQKMASLEFVNEYVQAEIPSLPLENDMSDLAIQLLRLHKIVTTNNLHDCSDYCLIDGKCSKNFPKPFNDTTTIGWQGKKYRRRQPTDAVQPLCPDNDADNDIVYQRRQAVPTTGLHNNAVQSSYGNVFAKKLKNGTVIQLDNRRVVPYNSYLFLKYNCHINVEYVYDEKCCRYTFKYIYKGNDQAYVRVEKIKKKLTNVNIDSDLNPGVEKTDDIETGNIVDYDEFEHVFQARYMTAQEAYMRLFSQPVVKLSHTVIRLIVHAPQGLPIIFQEGYEVEEAEALEKGKEKKASMLEGFFKLCTNDSDARQYIYEEIVENYSWNG